MVFGMFFGCICVRFYSVKFLNLKFLLEAMFIGVHIYRESVNTNCLFRPRLEAVTNKSIRNLESLSIFKKKILQFITPCLNNTYNYFNKK